MVKTQPRKGRKRGSCLSSIGAEQDFAGILTLGVLQARAALPGALGLQTLRWGSQGEATRKAHLQADPKPGVVTTGELLDRHLGLAQGVIVQCILVLGKHRDAIQ